ncbi:hypothetical protein JJP89_00005, partial [Enterobacter hormaechei]|nr:hypothetical protein [Enterobacter hormaechei]
IISNGKVANTFIFHVPFTKTKVVQAKSDTAKKYDSSKLSQPALAISHGANVNRNIFDDMIDEITSKLNPSGAAERVPLNVRIIDTP